MEITLIIVNIVAGIACGYPLARHLGRAGGRPERARSRYQLIALVYLVECVSMVVGMGIPVFSVFLSFIWAAVFGLLLSGRTDIRRTSLILALYTSLPAASFIVVPVVSMIAGWDVLSTDAGLSFGIPQHPFLPWPVRTILGFYVVLIVGAVVSKTAITVGGVSLVVRGERRKPRSAE